MDRRRYDQVRAPLSLPLGYALVFPLIGTQGGSTIGHITQILFRVIQSADGKAGEVGSIRQTLFPITQALAGEAPPAGVIRQTLERLSQQIDADAVYVVSGSASQRLASIIEHLAGETNHAEVAMILRAIQQRAIGGIEVKGTVAQLLSAVRQASAGYLPITATAEQILARLEQHAFGKVPNAGVIDQTLHGVTQTVSARTVNSEGVIDQLLDGIAQAINANMEIIHRGQIAMRVGHPILIEISAQVGPTARIAQTLSRLTITGEGMFHPTGIINQRLAQIFSTAIGSRSASIDQVLFPIRMAFVAGMESFGTASQHIGRIVQEADGWVSAKGVIGQTMPRVRIGGGFLISQTYGEIAQAIGRLQIHAEASANLTSTITQILPPLFQGAAAIEIFPGHSDQVLHRISQQAQVAISAAWGTVAQTLPRIMQEAEGYMPPRGAMIQVLPTIQHRADGWVEVIGPADQRLRAPLQSVTAVEKMQGTIVQELYPQRLITRGEGSALNFGHIDQALFPIWQSAEAWTSVLGQISQRLFRVFQDGGGLAPTFGTIDQRLFSATQSVEASARPSVRATSAMTLFGISQDVRGYRKVEGDIAQTLPSVSTVVFGDVGAGASIIDEEKMIPNGRLTLVAGEAWMSGTVAGATTVYYSPAIGTAIYHWTGSIWAADTFAELSQALSDTSHSPAATAASKNYDMFVWKDGGGNYQLSRGPAWTTQSNRGAGAGTGELIMQRGFFVNRYDITNGPAAGYGLYVGTIRTSASNAIDWNVSMDYNSLAQKTAVFNAFNPRQIVMNAYDELDFERDPIAAFKVLDVNASNTSGTVVDVSSNAFTVTKNGSVATVLDPAGSGKPVIDLRAAGAYLSVPYNSGFAPNLSTSILTWECWFYPTAVPSTYGGLIACAGATSGIALNTYQNAPRANTRSGGGYPEVTTAAKMSLNTWHYVVMTGCNGMLSIYVDNQLAGYGSLADGSGGTNTLVIGRTFDGYQNAGYYTGVRVYSGAARTPPMFRGF